MAHGDEVSRRKEPAIAALLANPTVLTLPRSASTCLLCANGSSSQDSKQAYAQARKFWSGCRAETPIPTEPLPAHCSGRFTEGMACRRCGFRRCSAAALSPIRQRHTLSRPSSGLWMRCNWPKFSYSLHGRRTSPKTQSCDPPSGMQEGPCGEVGEIMTARRKTS
jgi:hypothetical protein